MNHAVSWPEAAEDIVFCLCLFSILAFIFWTMPGAILAPNSFGSHVEEEVADAG